MADTDISICSRALVQLGAAPISALPDGTDASKVCVNVYEGAKRNLMSLYPWRFLMVKKNLTREAITPAGEWEYSYIIPPEAVGLVHAVFRSGSDVISTTEYEVFGQRIYTNHQVLIADFVAEMDEATWPAYFVELMVGVMCEKIAFAITDQQNVQTDWMNKVYGSPGENGRGGMMGQAMSQDSQGDGNPMLMSDEFVSARMGYHGGLINRNRWS